MQYCNKCNRPTENGVCVIHGNVDTHKDKKLDKIRQRLKGLIGDIKDGTKSEAEIIWHYSDRIKDI